MFVNFPKHLPFSYNKSTITLHYTRKIKSTDTCNCASHLNVFEWKYFTHNCILSVNDSRDLWQLLKYTNSTAGNFRLIIRMWIVKVLQNKLKIITVRQLKFNKTDHCASENQFIQKSMVGTVQWKQKKFTESIFKLRFRCSFSAISLHIC